ncbi:hypothetical protein LTR37_000168 [Vermiconidia calcicola]|uniref:Uncharacterized protein n=1 Tax=Vermiconidia calcicola TaxID=1690605 RepID=A0ACC3P119_9PEZI|nr:hypothetical protein LTR37_000168 [Vermiconidia calcicola]
MPGSECGADSLCYAPDGPRDETWYQAGCTDPNYEDPVCRNDCGLGAVAYTSSFIEYNDVTEEWACCGNGGCKGSVTNNTFKAVSPEEWTVISSAGSSSSATLSTSSSTSSNAAATPKTTGSPQPSGANANSLTPSSSPSPTAQHNSGLSTGANQNSSTTSISPSSEAQSHSGLSTDAKAGIGVAIGVGALALIAATIAIVMIRRKKKTAANKSWGNEKTLPPYPFEMSTQREHEEMSTENAVYELPNGSESGTGSDGYK